MTTQITPIEKTLAAIKDAKFQKEVKRMKAADAKFPELLKKIDEAASSGNTNVVWPEDGITPSIRESLERGGYYVQEGLGTGFIMIKFGMDYRTTPKSAKQGSKRSFFQYLTDTETGAFRGREGAFILGFCAMSALIIFVSILPSILRSIGLI